jgi:hypothetical protein
MVNGIPARNKDPNKKAADLAAFFTASLEVALFSAPSTCTVIIDAGR